MKCAPLLAALLLCTSAARAGEYPAPIRALIANGVTVQGEMPAPRGFHGYIGKYQGDPIPIYLLPDGQHIVVGTLYDARANDLTEAPFRAATTPGLDPSLWDRLAKAKWIAEGATRPTRIVYVFTDTECPFCHRFWLASQPYLRAGKVQIRDIIVAVIAPASFGRGAAVLAAPDPAAAWKRNELAFGHSPVKPLARVDAHTRAEIASNKLLLDRFNAYGTPVIVYRDRFGHVRMTQGAPDNETMRAIFGH